MLRRTDLALASLDPGPRGAAAGHEWAAAFRLSWADERHLLTVVVPALGRAQAEAAAWRALAGHLGDLAGRATGAAARVAPPARGRGPGRPAGGGLATA